jgi:hypothetical protein
MVLAWRPRLTGRASIAAITWCRQLTGKSRRREALKTGFFRAYISYCIADWVLGEMDYRTKSFIFLALLMVCESWTSLFEVKGV